MPNDTRRQWIEKRTAALEGATNPAEMAAAAAELASSDDPEALDALESFLRSDEFLDRLDEAGSADQTEHLRTVLAPFIQRPSPEVAHLCLNLVDHPAYLMNDRKSFLLEAMARVSPMNAETVEAFRRANEEGYFGFNALLLAANGSVRALELFASMTGDKAIDWEARVELLHKGIVPHRNRLSILEMAAGLMTTDLEEPVALAAIESVFDYQVHWFAIHAPMPPGWRTAPDEVLRFLIDLGRQAQRRPNLPVPLQEAIGATLEIAGALLARRTG